MPKKVKMKNKKKKGEEPVSEREGEKELADESVEELAGDDESDEGLPGLEEDEY